MEMKVSSQRPGLSSSDCASDPEEKEPSEGEEEDDDRNHKHRRREARFQSLEGDSLDQGFTRSYRKRDRPFENGYSYNMSSDRDFSSRVEKRRPNQGSFSRPPLELNKRVRGNQAMAGEFGYGRGRGRDSNPWGILDSRLGLVDVAPPIVQPGPVSSALFAGRGFPNVPNTQGTSWNAFGLVPGVPNCGLDPLHPLGLPGAMMPAISPPINIGIPRQRCRDFEERGFCLRGEMCPMEHGVNRIVIEDVQSLSQFNLPVSIPGSQLMGASSGQGALPVTSTASVSLVSSKAFQANHGKSGLNEDGNMGGSVAVASDVYDPDQLLWANDNPETSTALVALNQSNADETESLESYEGFNDDRLQRNAPVDGTHSSSVSGRRSNPKYRVAMKGKNDSAGASSSYLEQGIKNGHTLNTVPNVPYQGKWMHVDGKRPLNKESPHKAHPNPSQNSRRPSQKALRTLFVNCVPLKDNKREALLSHFQKFGEVIDIYIPMHSERAFVQFSKGEEAEAALKSPDAVMGNRFIKLAWANRDNIPDDVKTGTINVPIIPRGIAVNPALSRSFVLDKGKDNPHSAGGKDVHAPELPGHDHTKPVVATGPKANPPQQRKLETLELLKEELRKKQEMLDQKRNEFRRQLDKLEKHAVGSNDVAASDLSSKKLKGETPPDHAKVDPVESSPRDNNVTEKPVSSEPAALRTSTSSQTTPAPVHEPTKPTPRPLAPSATPFTPSRFKLDNRPTAFRIISPLPPGLADVAALKEHFATYGDLSSVELEDPELQRAADDASVSSNSSSARISFTTRQFAERAFLHGKSWQDHKLQFMWLTSINSGKEVAASGNLAAAASENSLDANGEVGKLEHLAIETGGDSTEPDKNESNSTSSSSLSPKQQC